MRGVRIVFKGLHDTFEHLLSYTLVSMVWWLGVLLIVTAPAATLALFRHTDPRIGTELDRPSWGETSTYMREHFARSWGLALVTAPLAAVLLFNLLTIRPGENSLGVLAPVWLFFLIVIAFIMASAFAIVACFDLAALQGLKRAAFLTAAFLPRALIVAVLLWLIVILGSVLVVPLFTFLPATVTATINRFVLDAHDVDVIDPLSPTDERLREEAIRRSSRFGP